VITRTSVNRRSTLFNQEKALQKQRLFLYSHFLQKHFASKNHFRTGDLSSPACLRVAASAKQGVSATESCGTRDEVEERRGWGQNRQQDFIPEMIFDTIESKIRDHPSAANATLNSLLTNCYTPPFRHYFP
jgi:hypothetical protein